jgi:alpha-galactosidase
MNADLHGFFSPPSVLICVNLRIKEISFNMKPLITLLFASLSISGFAQTEIKAVGQNAIRITAGNVSREISITPAGFYTSAIYIDGTGMLASPSNEVSIRIQDASPNREPKGLTELNSAVVLLNDPGNGSGTSLEIDKKADSGERPATQWTNPQILNAGRWGDVFNLIKYEITHPSPKTTRLCIRSRCTLPAGRRNGMFVDVYYEIYQDYPVIRKWVEVTNNSACWCKIDQLIIDELNIGDTFRKTTDFTPSERGAVSSIRGFSNEQCSKGLILVSEVPSALRTILPNGSMGYHPDFFEWILGPTERFVSEPVFVYGFSGEVIKTVSGISTPMDRAVESMFKKFLFDVVGLKSADAGKYEPLWCTWSNFGPLINDQNMREMANLASSMGIKTLLFDAGWAQSPKPESIIPIAALPDTVKFPNFEETCKYIREKNLHIGLWVTCFRHPELSEDVKALSGGYSLPKIQREEGLAMSYAGPWRYYYANDLLRLHDQFHGSYFKQDLTNIKFGDFAQKHDSRSPKESLLRGLRGLFESQDIICRSNPGIQLELTHEIYWGTPGAPCDVAALKHAHYYHVPPNDYSGAGHNKQRVSEKWTDNPNYQPDKMSRQLIDGCRNARQQFYAHRGLPLQSIEYYGAATVNFKGSLTPEIQQRQICSWLMGSPSVYAGDLASLTGENRDVYRKGFALLADLNRKYGIYRFFQYSGVPAPTDTDWHWWGKLNEAGHGAVVVLRGSEGDDNRQINIPWVNPESRYRIRLCFSDTYLGLYSGKALIAGKLSLSLPVCGQEIIEIMPHK